MIKGNGERMTMRTDKTEGTSGGGLTKRIVRERAAIAKSRSGELELHQGSGIKHTEGRGKVIGARVYIVNQAK